MLGIMTKEYEDKFNKLVKDIMAEAEEDGEPVTEEEAQEMAKMELGAKDITNYTQATVEKKAKKPRERKVDKNKASIINFLKNVLEDEELVIDEALILDIRVKPETEISFNYCGDEYTLKLTKHRPPKK